MFPGERLFLLSAQACQPLPTRVVLHPHLPLVGHGQDGEDPLWAKLGAEAAGNSAFVDRLRTRTSHHVRDVEVVVDAHSYDWLWVQGRDRAPLARIVRSGCRAMAAARRPQHDVAGQRRNGAG